MATRQRRLGWNAAWIAALLALLAFLPETSLAASRICRQLEAELATASRSGARNAAPARRQEAAIARQQAQLQAAKRQARGAGCGFRLFGGNSSSCGAINSKIDKMEQNLAALERRRSGATGTAKGRPRSLIIGDLQANRCRDEAIAERRPPRGLLDQLFGGGARQRESLDELGAPAVRSEEQRYVRRAPDSGTWVNDDGRIRYAAPAGTYRTLCVRTCDGYYFPMSSASSPSDFERDQANCQSSCPGSEVQVYYHRQGQESEDMRSSLSGAPYAELPTAYLYRQVGTQTPTGCTCNAPRNEATGNYSIVAGNPPVSDTVPPEPVTPHPTARPDPAADPETLANLDGGLDAEALKRMAVTPKLNNPQGGERRIRVVGPVFLPGPEGEEYPQVQVPTGAP